MKGYFDSRIINRYKKIFIPPKESYAANCLAVNGTVLIPKGYPGTKRLIQKQGFKIMELAMSEFRKGDGALTCLSIIF